MLQPEIVLIALAINEILRKGCVFKGQSLTWSLWAGLLLSEIFTVLTKL